MRKLDQEIYGFIYSTERSVQSREVVVYDIIYLFVVYLEMLMNMTGVEVNFVSYKQGLKNAFIFLVTNVMLPLPSIH